MNKIEELEARVRNLEELLNVTATKVEDVESRAFWDDAPSAERISYCCTKNHFHDTLSDAKACNESNNRG